MNKNRFILNEEDVVITLPKDKTEKKQWGDGSLRRILSLSNLAIN
jgi:hypothetical protein